jgi:hypothetical protein
MLALRDTNRFQSAYHLSQTGARAATCLHAYVHFPDEYELDADQLNNLFTILRLSQAAQRFDPRARAAATPAAQDSVIPAARDLHSLATAHTAAITPPSAASPSSTGN